MSKPKPYAEYIDSGVEWVGPIPAGWETRPLFAVARENTASNRCGGEENLLSLSYGRIVRKDIAGNDGLLPASFDTYQVISRDDIVLRLTDLQNDKRSLRSAISPERGIITSAYLAVTPTRIEPKFLSYLLRAYDLQKVFYAMGGGLRQSMKFSDMKWLPVVLPPVAQQQAISRYLDHETTQIDDLVGKQERLIELLNEKRQAVITQAVTKGLSPDVPTRHSGIPGLDDIPKHWNQKPLCHFMAGRVDYRGATPEKTDDGIFLVTAKNVRKGFIDYSASTEYVAPEDYKRVMSRGIPAIGDILMTMEAPLGNFALIDNPHVALAQRVIKFRPKEELVPAFAVYAANSPYFQTQLEQRATGSTALGLKASKLIELRLAAPTREEQQHIVDFLDTATKRIDGLMERARAGISLLLERRSALISAAVTGKIDVREEYAQL